MLTGFHIEYVIPTYDRSKTTKGNGGKSGRSPGCKPKLRDNGGSLLYGDGCLRHGIAHCEDCPSPDCDWNSATESRLRKKLNEGNNIH